MKKTILILAIAVSTAALFAFSSKKTKPVTPPTKQTETPMGPTGHVFSSNSQF